MSMWHRSLPLRFFNLRLLEVIGAILLVLAGSSAFAQQQEYTEIRRLGTSNAFFRPGPQTGDELRARFREYREDYEQVLREVGWPGNPDDLFQAVEDGQFAEARYPVGHTFEWMAIRKQGVPQATGPIVWAGDAPFDAFEIRFVSNEQEHRFLVPHACGNLALVEMRPAAPVIDIEAITPNLRVQAPNECVGTTVTVDVTVPGPGIPEGGSLQVTMTRPSGETETLEMTQAGGGFRWQGTLEDVGGYTFAAVVDTPVGPTRQVTQSINLEPCEPTCNIQLTPPPVDPAPRAERASIGIDTCQSSAEVGSITGRTVRIYHTPVDGPEQLIETLSLDAECRTDYVLPLYGTYRFELEVVDDRGMSATCEAQYTLVEPEAQLLPFFSVMGGKERRVREHDVATGQPADDDALATFLSGRCVPLIRGAVGLAFPFAEGGAQVFGQGGVAINTRDTENTSLFADIGIDKNFERGFVGAGVGVWDFNHSDTVDGSFFVHGGFNFTERLQWSFEGRLFTSELDDIENNYAFFGGIRYFWTK